MNLSLPPDGFPERLKLALGKKSARAFAAGCGLSSAAIHQYLSGKTEPTRPALVAIATHANVDLNWLVMGFGLMPASVPVTAGDPLVHRDIYEKLVEEDRERLSNETLLQLAAQVNAEVARRLRSKP